MTPRWGEEAQAESGNARVPECRSAESWSRLLLQPTLGYFKRHDGKSFDPQTAASFAFRQCRGAPLLFVRINRFSRQYQEVVEAGSDGLQILAPRGLQTIFDRGGDPSHIRV